MPIRLKRAYAAPEPEDGFRVLVDRLWPRGISRERLKIDAWLQDLAPSAGLRSWFGHDPEKWDEFCRRYFAELDGQGNLLGELVGRIRQGRVTLVFAAGDERRNNAVALRDYLERMARVGEAGRPEE